MAAGGLGPDQIELVTGAVDQHDPGPDVARAAGLGLVEDPADHVAGVGDHRSAQPFPHRLRPRTDGPAAVAGQPVAVPPGRQGQPPIGRIQVRDSGSAPGAAGDGYHSEHRDQQPPMPALQPVPPDAVGADRPAPRGAGAFGGPPFAGGAQVQVGLQHLPQQFTPLPLEQLLQPIVRPRRGLRAGELSEQTVERAFRVGRKVPRSRPAERCISRPPACPAAYLVFQATLPAHTLNGMSLTDPGVASAVAGGGLYLTALGLLGLDLGSVLRSSAGAIATLFGLLFILPLLLNLLPDPGRTPLAPTFRCDKGPDLCRRLPRSGQPRPVDRFRCVLPLRRGGPGRRLRPHRTRRCMRPP
ncbi:hypothetical protein BS35_008644 [Actinomadura glauciflava]|nr:hypothetical protein [Actinomadura glauciflava]